MKRRAPEYAKIDPGIRSIVRILWEDGIETYESCEGGRGHAFPEPTVRFSGGHGEGFRALETAIERSKRDEKLTWADLVADKQTFRNDHPVRPNSADKLAEAARIRNK